MKRKKIIGDIKLLIRLSILDFDPIDFERVRSDKIDVKRLICV